MFCVHIWLISQAAELLKSIRVSSISRSLSLLLSEDVLPQIPSSSPSSHNLSALLQAAGCHLSLPAVVNQAPMNSGTSSREHLHPIVWRR